MNRWKTKKKAKDVESSVRGPSTDSEAPPMPTLKTSKTFMFGRKASEPEPKPEIDLEHALPSKDDFRTSLLMSGLSARFSMLREQDDPTSKIGKASDDSVLFPNRQSRLNDFGFQSNGLSDIAEVSSIHGSIRPALATSRTDSYHDGYGVDEDGGSIMNRKKPTDGNNLFGGRQKIYKIPLTGAASTKSVNETSSGGGMSGRALYDDDVSQSAFQKMRDRERQELREREEREQQQDEVPSRSTSPTLTGYNRNRETSSTTTTSSLARSSTAATSVTSQRTPSLTSAQNPVNPVLAKTRRLYENGLDQQLHEQQNSAINRLDSLSRQRKLGVQTPPPGVTSPVIGSATNDKWERHPMAGKQSMPNLRAASPSPAITPIGTFDFGVKPIMPSNSKPWGVSSPPLSPPTSDYGDNSIPILPVQPNDRGKATALGAFVKPAHAYDDNKYTQRQLQMQQGRDTGRETPTLRKQSPPRSFAPRPQQQQPQMPRNRADSSATSSSSRSRSNSSAGRTFPTHEASQIFHQQPLPEDSVAPSGTFLASPDHSPQSMANAYDDYQQHSAPPAFDFPRLRTVPEINMERPPESQHPANRSPAFEPRLPDVQLKKVEANDKTAFAFAPSSVDTTSHLTTPIEGPPVDSPTLGPTSGLSNIRQHLRSDSNTSSVYSAMPSADLTSRFPEHPVPESPSESAGKNAQWEENGWERGYDGAFGDRNAVRSPPKSSLPKPPSSARPVNLESASPAGGRPSWEQEIESHHNRNGSSATQKEQQDFQDELAARRRQIKENMKSFVETESRSSSPVPGADSSRDYNPMKHPALSMLKSKTSRTSLAGKQPKESGQTKAMKMLGFNGNSSNNSESESPVKHGYGDNSWQQEEEEMLRGLPKPNVTPPQTKAFRQARRDAQRDRERQMAERHQNEGRPSMEVAGQWKSDTSQGPRGIGADRFPPNIRTGPRDISRDRKPPPVAYIPREEAPQENGSRAASRSSRDRSSSDASGRSKSRNGPYKDDLAKAMAEGISSSGQGYEELSVPGNRYPARSPGALSNFQPSPIPSPMVGTPRSRSNSVMTPGGYFEPVQKFPTLQPTSEMDHLAPRPSPAFSVNSTPSLARPSPVPSLANTPTAPAFQNQPHTKLPVMAARKRSINKYEISEPTLISSTSRITTVNLPPGSSLQNGIEPHSAPPIPPVNPRRRQTRTMFGFSRKDELDEHLHSLPQATQSTEEMSTFSADEGEKPRVKERQRLRKSSSEGGALNARARQAAFAAQSPALPTSPFPTNVNRSPPRPSVEGGMF